MFEVINNLLWNKSKKLEVLTNVFGDQEVALAYYDRNKKFINFMSLKNLSLIAPYYIKTDIRLEQKYLEALNKKTIKNLKLINLDDSIKTFSPGEIKEMFSIKEFVVNANEFSKLTNITIADVFRKYKNSVNYVCDPRFVKLLMSMKDYSIDKIITSYPLLQMINDINVINYLATHGIDINMFLDSLNNITDISVDILNKVFSVNFLSRLSLNSLNKLFNNKFSSNVYSNDNLKLLSTYADSNKMELLNTRIKYNLPVTESDDYDSIYEALGSDYLYDYIYSNYLGITPSAEIVNELRRILNSIPDIEQTNSKTIFLQKYSEFISIIKILVDTTLTKEEYMQLYNIVRNKNYRQTYMNFIADYQKTIDNR